MATNQIVYIIVTQKRDRLGPDEVYSYCFDCRNIASLEIVNLKQLSCFFVH